MTTLETLLKQVEELDAKATKGWVKQNGLYPDRAWIDGTVNSSIAHGAIFSHEEGELIATYRTAAPILVEVIRKLVEQRDGYAEALNLPTTNSGRKDNADLDTIVAKRLKGEK